MLGPTRPNGGHDGREVAHESTLLVWHGHGHGSFHVDHERIVA